LGFYTSDSPGALKIIHHPVIELPPLRNFCTAKHHGLVLMCLEVRQIVDVNRQARRWLETYESWGLVRFILFYCGSDLFFAIQNGLIGRIIRRTDWLIA
jgi:hypothetical protein